MKFCISILFFFLILTLFSYVADKLQEWSVCLQKRDANAGARGADNLGFDREDVSNQHASLTC